MGLGFGSGLERLEPTFCAAQQRGAPPVHGAGHACACVYVCVCLGEGVQVVKGG